VSEAAAFEETAELEPEPIEEQAAIEVPPWKKSRLWKNPPLRCPKENCSPGMTQLSWLQSLTVGKEDELRAQAEAEAQVRVAEIMGRKPEEKPIAETPVIEGPAGTAISAATPAAGPEEEVVPEDPTAPMPEGELLSGDDALSWLQSLTVGKEDELRAQAEAEAQVRVAEIMGRKPEEKPVAEVPVIEGPAGEAIPPKNPRSVPEEEVVTEDPPLDARRGAPSGDDALSWLQSLTVGKEDELRAQAEAEAQVRVAEIMGRKPEEKPAAEAPVIEGPAGEPTPPETPVAEEEVVPEEVIAAEELVEEEEIIVEELQPTAEELVAEEEIIVEEKPAPLPEEAVEVIPEVSFEAAIEEPAAPIIEKVVQAAPPIKVTRPAVETVSVPTMSTTELEKGRTYIKKHRSDHASRLALARVLWDAGEMEESLDLYSRLIRSNQLMDEVIVDLKRYSEEKPHSPDVLRTLGDSYMKQGLLDKAMEIYRQAMDML
jgi:tetratricopeptide (TPR) repeat protein